MSIKFLEDNIKVIDSLDYIYNWKDNILDNVVEKISNFINN